MLLASHSIVFPYRWPDRIHVIAAGASLASFATPELPQHAVRYTRLVTWVWAGFFLSNGLVVTALTLWAPLSWWTLYTGLIAYALMGLLFAAEWLIRQRVRRDG